MRKLLAAIMAILFLFGSTVVSAEGIDLTVLSTDELEGLILSALIEIDNREDSGSVTASGECGKDVHYTLYSDGTISITGTGAMADYSYLKSENAPWYSYRDKIKSAVISEGITTLGESAFQDCTNLAEITIPDSVTSINESALESCSSLSNIDIPSSVNNFGQYAFYKCSALKTIIIPDGVTSIKDKTFSKCSALTNIYMPTSIEAISDNAFDGCDNLCVTSEEGSYAYDWAVNKGYNVPNQSDDMPIAIGDGWEITKEFYYSTGWDNNYIFVLKNTSGYNAAISVIVYFYDANNNLVGVANGSERACENGHYTYWSFSNDDVGFDHVEIDITMSEETYYHCAQSSIELATSVVGKKVIIAAKNIGNMPVEFVEYNIIFLNENGELVATDWGFLDDVDGEIKPGKTEMREATPSESFADVLVYAHGWIE